VDNLILLIIKHYIYSTRCYQKPLTIKGLVNSIKDNYDGLKHTANSKGDTYRINFEKRWLKWQRILEFIQIRNINLQFAGDKNAKKQLINEKKIN